MDSTVLNTKNGVLHQLSITKSIIIPSCDGSQTLAKASNVFPSYIDPDFMKWNLDIPGNASPETQLQIYELVENATFVQMALSLGAEFEKICLTQHQIELYCKLHKFEFRSEGYASFFMFQVENKPYVAQVLMSSDGLGVHVFRFNNKHNWGAGDCYRLVVPQYFFDLLYK